MQKSMHSVPLVSLPTPTPTPTKKWKDQKQLKSSTPNTVGKGLKPKAGVYKKGITFIMGGGSPKLTETEYKDINMIDMTRLNKNYLCVKYIKTRNTVTTIPKIMISSNVRNMIIEILDDKFNKDKFNKLNEHDREIIKSFAGNCKINLGIPDSDSVQEQYQLLLGEYYAGNTSPVVIKSLKRYVSLAVAKKLISKTDTLLILAELN